ncbi:hypothetical protein AB0D27_06345 [Streptomyces sp. NPDC048415]|uniref:hypothetical protein n=1 Tax=Streptomyces sp. NPDC048415 TaxID=3154822 RepID=UPI003424164A
MDDEVQSALVLHEQSLGATGVAERFVPLGQGKVLLPLTEEIWDCIGAELADNPDDAGELDYFMSVVLRCAGCEELRGNVVFIEAQPGRESSIVTTDAVVSTSSVWEEGQADGLMEAVDRPINAALRAVGVERGRWPDECAAIGLAIPFSR